jgi:hypothetical protein
MRWFKPFGLLFLPVSVVGAAVTALAAAGCVEAFVQVDGRSHSASDTIDGVTPYWVSVVALWWTIAMATSRSPEREP